MRCRIAVFASLYVRRLASGYMEEQVLELALRSVEEAEVYSVTSSQTPVAFEANRLKQLQTKEVRGLALRVLWNGRIGLAAATRLDDPARLVQTALDLARFGAQARFTLPAARPVPVPLVYDRSVAALSVDEMVRLGQGMIDQVRAHDGAVVCDADIRVSTSRVRVLNSRGTEHSVHKTVIGADIHANLVRGTDMLDVYEAASSCRLPLDFAGLASTTIGKLEQARRSAVVCTKSMPVVFTPKGVAMTLIGPLKLALSGKMVFQGASPLGEKLGQAVADPRFSLFDDGTLDWAPGSSPCDDEGMPCQRTALIENGVVSRFYYDLQTAGLAGAASTGNGFRSLESLPNPATTSLVVATGDLSYQDMIADMEEGLVVDQTMGAWSGNVIAGEFSANVHLGYKVEKGRVVGRVKDTMVAGNIWQALTELVAVGSQPEWVGDVFTPALYFRGLGVVSK